MVDPSAAFEFNLSAPLTGLLGFASPSSESLYLLGMTGSVAWLCGHWWTILTANFLHGSLLHIFFNLSWLRTLGTLCLQLFGPIRLINIYILTGAGGFLFSNLYKNHPTIGASCALFGLMGVLISYGRRRGGTFGDALSKQVWTWAIVGFLISFAIPMVNNAGHAGGFVTGLLMGRLLPVHGQRSNRSEQLIALALVIGTIAGFGLSMWKMWSPVTDGTPVCM